MVAALLTGPTPFSPRTGAGPQAANGRVDGVAPSSAIAADARPPVASGRTAGCCRLRRRCQRVPRGWSRAKHRWDSVLPCGRCPDPRGGRQINGRCSFPQCWSVFAHRRVSEPRHFHRQQDNTDESPRHPRRQSHRRQRHLHQGQQRTGCVQFPPHPAFAPRRSARRPPRWPPHDRRTPHTAREALDL